MSLVSSQLQVVTLWPVAMAASGHLLRLGVPAWRPASTVASTGSSCIQRSRVTGPSSSFPPGASPICLSNHLRCSPPVPFAYSAISQQSRTYSAANEWAARRGRAPTESSSDEELFKTDDEEMLVVIDEDEFEGGEEEWLDDNDLGTDDELGELDDFDEDEVEEEEEEAEPRLKR